ncbi:23S rRNA (uracil(1939)-C(5))-methyltransferase RlmD [Patescibacteria group bacterium]|jgi:23S rRNA (uracil-5-)-methyltransferase RumA|nr:23S rRNA (uracil(1939)-C(5))-methyltransferase RlmD [Patescibacteria group bacterium]
MKFGDPISGKITDLDHKGRGTFEKYVIPFTAPGDEVEATFVKRDSGTRIGRLAKIVTPSADRIEAPCPHAGVCGGCLWQHLAYEAQLRLKKEMINRAFEQAGHEERVSDVMPSTEEFYYRNRMDYVVGWKGELGLKEYGSWNRYLDLSTCLLLDKETPRILQNVRELMRELGLQPWDAKKYTGDVRYCVIRLGKNTNERMISLVVHDLNVFDDAKRAKITERLSPFATSLYLAENPEITDVSQGKTLELLHGNEYLTEEVNGIRYTIHPNSFFQTNTQMAGKLQAAVMNLLPPGKILDLYCGLGFLGIAAAKRGNDVYGHELDAPAIELAKVNAEANGVAEKTRWGAGPTEALDWSAEKPEAVIVDPPRAGLHPKALKALVENAPPRIVYVSCNYHRLVDELKTLKTKYRVESLQALDLFPQTPHVEVVASLVLN